MDNVREVESAPHEALFFSLRYLSLPDLLTIQRVCKSFREAINGDPLIWRSIRVENPISRNLRDDYLLKLTAKAQGQLTSLTLVGCWRITEDGLLQVIRSNPFITKLCVPGCTCLSPGGLVKLVEGGGLPRLRHLSLHGLYNITHEHLHRLNSLLSPRNQPLSQRSRRRLYGVQNMAITDGNEDTHQSLDIEICPKCKGTRLVFDCPRDGSSHECRGCIFCIPRCEECGQCLCPDEIEMTFCADLLCPPCWLNLPKCLLCNRPGCARHAGPHARSPGAHFVCESCHYHQTSLLL
ncbi:F-box protein SKIP28 isoform X2 [Amborella trichopoda]|uniref:F-box domain-containing protein n=2 Tax=Amborella trichopoda TaxID=13333 RepID=W1NL27_AMBTC|nr:F-box protein SKIP28 isoform X2 [Amborella trichopoda]ERM95925.1 hypothetical protein AMTR_s00060p00187100 [Amborella trichopoda]|eukprot:XP_020530978.1 F-box protein SKIP28 isoform X2 [Amborella trichopoda]